MAALHPEAVGWAPLRPVHAALTCAAACLCTGWRARSVPALPDCGVPDATFWSQCEILAEGLRIFRPFLSPPFQTLMTDCRLEYSPNSVLL
jgi:hypothetical protein